MHDQCRQPRKPTAPGSECAGLSPGVIEPRSAVEQCQRPGGAHPRRARFASDDSVNPPAALDETCKALSDVPAADDQQSLAAKASGQCPEACAAG